MLVCSYVNIVLFNCILLYIHEYDIISLYLYLCFTIYKANLIFLFYSDIAYIHRAIRAILSRKACYCT